MAYLSQDPDSDRPLTSAPSSRPATVYGGMLAPVPHPPSQLLEYWQVIRANFLFIVILASVGALVGWTVSLIRPSMYQARTVLDIRNLNENILTENASASIGTSGTVLPESYLQTEIKILQSDSIRKRAVDQLIKEKRPIGSQKVDPAPAWSLGALDPGNIPFEKLVADAAGRIKVRALGNTRMVDMLCDARDAQLAADVCNHIARTYIQYNIESRAASTKETGDWLSSRLDDLRVRLTTAEAELKDASRESSVILDSDVENLAQEKLRQLQSEISKIEAERIYKESEYEVVQRTPAGALPLALDAGPIRDYRLRLTELRRQVAELTSTMTPAHYRVRELTNQITELETALKSEQTNLISRLKADYQTALQRESMLQKAYDQQAEVVTQRGEMGVG
jgi:succinoglycan biosynthesis transport protein ExoP